ncbi:hypothetical protein ACRALDRAFT_2055475 [Sodiomyces alcalophilus JCM 7366]|uniref:uncharacterized protein n=1 Tax=Sodiomyces alcalophilus JCM 7366 TaxID=591952 RepID=UPI0039B6086A
MPQPPGLPMMPSAPTYQPHIDVMSEAKGPGADINTSANAQKQHLRGKRKRTTARDKYILEAAYQVNPKPDKASRCDLVHRVSLTEKEVQIWFQNRRQNDRRRLRPLSPQDIAVLRNSVTHVLRTPAAVTHSPQVGPQTLQALLPHTDLAWSRALELKQSLVQSHLPMETGSMNNSGCCDRDTPDSIVSSRNPKPSNPPTHEESQRRLFLVKTNPSNTTRYVANRWNSPRCCSKRSEFAQAVAPRLEQTPLSSRTRGAFNASSIRRHIYDSQSQFRLSLSLEGKAEVVTNEHSPSPMPSSRLPSGFIPVSYPPPDPSQYSQIALTSITLPPMSTSTDSFPSAPSRRRSHNVQAWEHCCDSDKQDELTVQAESESSGSAIAAISLLRSTSITFRPNSIKRNISPVKGSGQARTVNRPCLSSTLSNSMSPNRDRHGKASSGTTRGEKHSSLPLLAAGSDKENWTPRVDRDSHAPPRQRVSRSQRNLLPGRESRPSFFLGGISRQRQVLRDLSGQHVNSACKTALLFHCPEFDRAGRMPQDTQLVESIPEDDEVDEFLSGAMSLSKRGDIDCIAGLLSLRRGNWR